MEIVDEAYRPTHPAKPSSVTILLMGLALAFVLALGLALALAIFDDRIYDRTDIEQLGLGPLVAVVPRAARAREAARG
jgi:capsular polysaccharide biosynthesis protein